MQLSGIIECGLRRKKSKRKVLHDVVSNNVSFVVEQGDSKARCWVQSTLGHTWSAACVFSYLHRKRVLGLHPASSHAGVGIVVLDHRWDKDGKTESRHVVLLWTGKDDGCRMCLSWRSCCCLLVVWRYPRRHHRPCGWSWVLLTNVQNSSVDHGSMVRKENPNRREDSAYLAKCRIKWMGQIHKGIRLEAVLAVLCVW